MIRTIAVLTVSLTLVGCGPSHLETYETLRVEESAEILDTEENREVLQVVNAYRVALKNRSAADLDVLISDEYYENGGTNDTTEDDYGRSGVPQVLARLEEQVKEINFDIVVKDMKVQGDRAWVIFEYLWNYKYQVGEVPKWESGRDINRIDLVRLDGGPWKITRGL
jgi:hypothetical protein